MPNFAIRIKVDKSIKPVPYDQRKRFELVKGQMYYVSFDKNIATPCRLTGVFEKGVTIDVKTKPLSKRGYIDKNGKVSHDWIEPYSLVNDEIGRTPEEAVTNEVTLLDFFF